MSRAVVTRELFQLNNVSGGLQPGTISFKTLTMESDKFVCIRDVQSDGQTSLVIADIAKGSSERHNIKDAEAAIMNPGSKILALRSGLALQVFDLEKRDRVKSTTLAEPVAFWKWINVSTIAIVTTTTVFHWNMDPRAPNDPVRVFDRAAEMDANVQILSYRVDAANTWMMLCGIHRAADGTFSGKTQLFSVENGGSRVLDGHAGCFHSMPTPKDPRLSNVLCLAWNGPAGGRVVIMELPSTQKPDASLERKNIPLALTSPQDFPVFCHVSPVHKLLFIVTSRGSAFVIDVITGLQISKEEVTPNVIFAAAAYEATGGVMCVNTSGSVFHVSIDNDQIARYVYGTLRNPEVALRIAASAGLSGLDDVFRAQFANLLQQGDVAGAIDICKSAPNHSLRTPDTLQRFIMMAPAPGQTPPISLYFKTMLAVGSLNAAEGVELCKAVLPKGGLPFVRQQFDEGKLTLTEDLGDLIAAVDPEFAMKVYFGAKAHHKVVNVLLSKNETQKAVEYCKRVEYSPDWRIVLMNFVRVNAKDAVALALMLHRDMGATPVIDPSEVVEMFLPGQFIREATMFLVEVLKDNNTPATAALQTRLLEINLKHSPPAVADRIFQQNMCSYYDPAVIGPLCERAQLWQHALECYHKVQVATKHEAPMLANIKRCLQHAAPTVPPEWLLEYFGKLIPADRFECLKDLVTINAQANLKVIVQAAAKYSESIGPEKLIDLFLIGDHFDILFYYLGTIVAFTRNPEVHFRYIQAATEMSQFAEVERMTRESPCYDGERTKNYLKEKHLADLWPLINVCDKYEFINELVKYLIDAGHGNFIEQYVQRRNPLNTPKVVAAMLDYNAEEKVIQAVMDAAGSMCPIAELVQEIEERGRLKLARRWLEARLAEKRTEAALHTALAKIYVDMVDPAAEAFLSTNEFYDSATIGKYCESRDPQFALLAYQRGNCHQELIDVCIKNGMWKALARHLIRQQNTDLWMTVLRDKSFEQKHLIEAVRQDSFAECKVAEDVIVAVRAFMKADLLSELSTILEELVIGGRFAKNRYLENLLLISAIKGRRQKVMEYVNKLQDYDVPDIATIALGAGMGDVAYLMYHRGNYFKEAINVLLHDIRPTDLARARTYAVEVNKPEVWTVLGEHLLQVDDLHEAVEAFIHARNPDFVQEVGDAADRLNQFGDLIKYLNMARVECKTKDPRIDTALMLTYAKTGRLGELEEFLKTSHGVQVMGIADKCFNDGLFDSARVLYQAASNFPKLAITFVRLRNFQAAVDAATKAQTAKTWKEVMLACLEAEEQKLANQCAGNLAIIAEELQDLIRVYELAGYSDELLNVLKASLTAQGAHNALYTELGVLYAKYKPDRLLEHIKVYPKKINLHRLVNACQLYHLWVPLRVLHITNEDWLSAAQSMMEHAADAWDHEIMKDVVQKLGSSDLCYTAIGFYINHHPDLLHDYLTTVSKKVDSERVMNEVKKLAPLTLIKPFLEATQDRNVRRVNDALNQMYVEEEDFTGLRRSVDTFNNFDSAELSAQLEKLDMFEFRRIALLLHRRNKRYFHAIETAKANELFMDAIESAAESRDRDLVRNLALWFCEAKKADCFAALLFQCYDLIDQPTVMELAWIYDMKEASTPYMIQAAQETQDRLAALEKAQSEAQKTAAKASAAQGAAQAAAPPLMIAGF